MAFSQDYMCLHTIWRCLLCANSIRAVAVIHYTFGYPNKRHWGFIIIVIVGALAIWGDSPVLATYDCTSPITIALFLLVLLV